MFVGRFGVAVCLFMVVVITVLETRQAYAQVAGATLSGTVISLSCQ
jgi:hypothetical protein